MTVRFGPGALALEKPELKSYNAVMYRDWLVANYDHWVRPVIGGAPFKLVLGAFAALLIWSLIWKGLALWKAARRGEWVWFVVLLLVNTLGILEILYIFVFSQKAGPVDKI